MLKRLLILIQILILVSVPTSYGQDNKEIPIVVTLGGDSINVASLMETIDAQTGFNFTYNTKIIDVNRKFFLHEGEAELHEILVALSSLLELEYKVIGNHVVLFDGQTPMGKITVSGKIVDNDTREPLEYANVSLRLRGIGTVTNADGEFLLNVPAEYADDSLVFSYIGYKNEYFGVDAVASNNMTIRLVRDYIPIQEVIVRVRDPRSILQGAIRGLPENYGNTPALLTGFYREGITRKNELQIYSEAVLKIYKAAYTGSFASDQVKVLRSRKIENLDAKDTLAIRLAAGIETILSLDGAKNLFEFIDPAYSQSYNYIFSDIVSVDEGSAFVLSFEQNRWIEDPLFKGDIYINTNDNAILMALFEINPVYIAKLQNQYVSKVPAGYSVQTEYVRYSVRYRKEGNRYYLSHVRGDLGFLAKSNKKLFNSRYNVFVELAVTGVETDTVVRFDRSETIPSGTIFTQTINGYDDGFWKDFDFIKPDESLEKSLRKLEVELGVYETENE